MVGWKTVSGCGAVVALGAIAADCDVDGLTGILRLVALIGAIVTMSGLGIWQIHKVNRPIWAVAEDAYDRGYQRRVREEAEEAREKFGVVRQLRGRDVG